MGVPRLAYWLAETFPEFIKNIPNIIGQDISKIKTALEVDNVYIDSNAIIHNWAGTVYNYKEPKSLLDRFAKYSEQEKQLKVFEFFFKRICELIKIVKPKKLLYIAIDGCAPLGKQAQQRQRRFVSVRDRNKSISDNPNKFNSNCISPGTLFMKQLTLYMNRVIKEEMLKEHSSIPKDIRVIFSSADVPGEGEHKIIEFIRYCPNKDKESHCMYGPDGDLIMLGLATHCPKFYLLREDSQSPSILNLLNIGGIHTGIAEKMGFKNTEKNSFSEYEVNLINDFLLLGFFVGNDFLPKVQMFYYLEDGVKLMLDTYNKIKDKFKIFETKTTITSLKNTSDIGLINYKFFHMFVKEVASQEKLFLESQSCVEVKDQKYMNRTLLECVYSGELDMNAYSKLYNERKCHINTMDDLASFCWEYIRGIDWVYKYYTQGCPQYRWYYPYHYAPLLTDLDKFMNLVSNTENFQMEFKLDEPSYPYQQLLCILPPQSYILLPPKLWSLLQNDDSPLRKYCPTSFEIDYEGKYKDYQGVAILPLMDFDTMNKEYQNAMKNEREKRGNIMIYKLSDKKVNILKVSIDS